MSLARRHVRLLLHASASVAGLKRCFFANNQQDWSRLGKASLVGVVNVGLWPYYWYKLVDTYLPNQVRVCERQVLPGCAHVCEHIHIREHALAVPKT